MVEQPQARLGTVAHDVAQPHALEELAAVAVLLEELLVTKHLVGELSTGQRAVAERGRAHECAVERAHLALEELVGLREAQQPAVDPQARVEVQDLAAQVRRLGRVLHHARHLGKRAWAGSQQRAGLGAVLSRLRPRLLAAALGGRLLRARTARGGRLRVCALGARGSLRRRRIGLGGTLRGGRLGLRVLGLLGALALGQGQVEAARLARGHEHAGAPERRTRGGARAAVPLEHRVDVRQRERVLAKPHEAARDAARVAAHRPVRDLGQHLGKAHDHALFLDGKLLCHDCPFLASQPF